MSDAREPGAVARRAGRRRLLGLAAFGLLCGLVDLAAAWRAEHPHVDDAYRRLYLVPGGIVNGATGSATRPG
ncbi:hypothetical protein AA13595_1212 [Gluconacetobacter johannae DSM 13595]|uniref:Uncharacterized protein n=1 Tax=Gluconacetobacter johannae TaxID=112140 RepID=A0A7W4P671_9PROT|nr:hypothetical protein [Gluconacetobacter johannae]MBB2175575.1 hypothetical protein [Gluconacetobacter johannae]GBQ83593.1 hypothetical protein AA13595_1212 [Gluconacetobacter johannae DSM 13595]